MSLSLTVTGLAVNQILSVLQGVTFISGILQVLRGTTGCYINQPVDSSRSLF